MAELREGLRSLYALDDAYGGVDVRSLAVRHLSRVRRVINTTSCPESIARQLQLLAGETAEHCAWLHYDADDQEQARRYWGEALAIGTMLGDTGLEALVLASLSMQSLHDGRPRDGYDFARAARQRAQSMGSPKLISLVAAREARALAQLRDVRAARRVFAEAMRMADREGGRPAPAWAAFHGQAEIDFAQGLLHAETGHHKAAVPFLRASLGHQGSTYGRNRALYRLTLARSLIHSGEAEEAAHEAVGALEHLVEVRSGRVLRRLAQVRDGLAVIDTASARSAVGVINAHLG
ncbi:hypothetical protein [Streptomyces sp. URMC 129]|uniref:hypothetical protein n=1 Tax=Streptomyces sp. URMC 129 TaxID=3423407 RepID=UPI003F1AE707